MKRSTVHLSLLVLSTFCVAQQTHIPDIGGFTTRVDLSELAKPEEATAPAPSLHYYPTNTLSALPPAAFANALIPRSSTGIHQVVIPSARWLVLPDATHADIDLAKLLNALPSQLHNEAGPLEIRLHADNKFSLALAIGDNDLKHLPAGLDLSPGSAASWLACKIPTPSKGRADSRIMTGVQRLRKHAQTARLQLHTGDLMLVPFQTETSTPDYLLCMRIAENR